MDTDDGCKPIPRTKTSKFPEKKPPINSPSPCVREGRNSQRENLFMLIKRIEEENLIQGQWSSQKGEGKWLNAKHWAS